MIDGGCGLCDDDGDDAVIYFIINNDNNYGYIVKLQFRVLNLHVFENYSVFFYGICCYWLMNGLILKAF